ncbi:T9SS type A sorting domain-containing protein [Winogradskyella luteola]|uniref:T9SS type A sorting domain-containing protein n=1 Tax=Winogradskyella luteola TaxID=2828330 RepID=A0A9X1JP88_9FLAO|nr:T9SS type A sorting domain-containing protein [Winogradskyella luteola]MBV7270206.1 T9SS type A sorting domain-containing protein [Winogradskyella luteola]
MKKITLMCFAILAFCWQSNAQIIDENASWPNAAWTVTGTYNAGATSFEADPTVDDRFSFDDDDAGNPNSDDIAAESPIIDLTPADLGGENLMKVSGNYFFREVVLNNEDKLALQWWDADNTVWVDWLVLTGVTTGATNEYCSATLGAYESDALDISGFSATQLSGFRYRIFYDDDADGGNGWEYGFCMDSPTLVSSADTTLDFYNLQFPQTGTIDGVEEFLVFAQAFEPGITDQGSANAAPEIEAWIGFNDMDTDPSGAEWTWVAAVPNPSWDFAGQNNDEYQVDLGSEVPGAGTYYYASRFRLNGASFTYGGFNTGSGDGVWDGTDDVSGTLTVNPPVNDECDDPIALTVNTDLSCTDVTSGTTVSATESTQDATGTSGEPNNDVWFSFTATSEQHVISLENVTAVIGTATDMGMTLYETTGDCDALAFVQTSDPNSMTVTGLTIGSDYVLRVYGWATGAATAQTNFEVCVGTPPPPPPNDDCANAELIVISDICNVITTSTFSATEGTDELPSCDTSGNLGLWYTFEGPASGEVIFESATPGMGMVIYDGTCGAFTEADGCANDPTSNTQTFSGLTPGTTYYAMFWTDTAQDPAEFCLYSLNCTPATVNYTIVDDCANSGGFNIDVEITDMGTATGLTISDDQGSADQNVTMTGTYTFGPYVNGTDVIVTVADDTDAACTQDSGTITQAVCPPDNVDCDTAEAVTLGINEAGPEVTGTNVGAGDSGVPDPSCNNFYDGSDLWYSFTTPADVDVVTLDIASSGFSSTISVIYDNCTDLNEIDCDIQFTSAPTVDFENLASNTTYILRLYDFSGDDFGPISFNMSATTALSIDDVQGEAAFTYYPNPVKNTLTLNARNTIENVTMYNMLGQEVLRSMPNNVDSELDMSSLQNGTYFVKVTIANITKTVRVVKQ